VLEEHLDILQTVRLKGRTSVAAAATATGCDDLAAGEALRELSAGGLTEEANGRHRLTPTGRERLTEWLATERDGVDQPALAALYTQFTGCNAELKQLAFEWQQREGEVNDHTDAVYDQAILDRLAGMHARFAPVLDRLIAVAPRLAPYPLRFSAAMAAIAEGWAGTLAQMLLARTRSRTATDEGGRRA
jgi:hypothetical protein